MENPSSDAEVPVEYHFDDELPNGEWNCYLLVAQETKLSLLLNGKPIGESLPELHRTHPQYFHLKVLALLEYLRSHPDQPLSKDRISLKVFGRAKAGASLSTGLYKLRRLLGDSRPHRLIRDVGGGQLWFNLKRKPSAPYIAPPEEDAGVSRLDLFGILSSLIELAIKSEGLPKRQNQPSPLTQLLTTSDPDSPLEVCDAFFKSFAGAEFQFRCTVFFEQYLHIHRTDAVERLTHTTDVLRQQEEYKTDPHRLEALPAAAAAHLLGATAESEGKQREHLNNVLAAAIRSDHPQVVEITFQNLIGAAATNPDVARHFRLANVLVDAIEDVVKKRLDPEYLGGLCSSVLFLLNCKLLYAERGEEVPDLDSIIEKVEAHAGSWCWYVRHFIKLHRSAFDSSQSAPPYLSEYCLVDPRRLNAAKRAYQEHVAVIYAKLFHAAYRQAHASGSGVYDLDAARRSYGKAGAHIYNHPIRKHLFSRDPRNGKLDIPVDPELTGFINGDFESILNSDENVKLFAPTASQLHLAAEAPFVRFQDKRIALQAEQSGAIVHVKEELQKLEVRRQRGEALVRLWLELAQLFPSRFVGKPPDQFSVDEVLSTVRWAKQHLAGLFRETTLRVGEYRTR